MCRWIAIALSLATLAAASARAADVTVGEGGKKAPAVRDLTAPKHYMPDLTRYDTQKRADKLLGKPKPVTRQDYLAFIYEESPYAPKAIIETPDRGHYGVRHAFPALAHYAASGDKALGRAIKKCLRLYDTAVRNDVKKDGWQWRYMHDPTLLCMYRKVFQEKKSWSPADEKWFKGFFPWMCRTVHVWGTKPDFWRGPMHRSTGEAMMKRLAVAMYPDVPEAAVWKRYVELQWGDVWPYRDNPINDTGYFNGQAFPMALGAHLLGMKEVFADARMRKFWDRLIHMTGPDGSIIPFGPQSGWNAGDGERLMFLELAATHTGDGRYRFAAHRIFNYMRSQADVLRGNHMLDHFSQLGVAVAYLVADDSIKPVEPEAGSIVLHHAETLRVKGKEGAKHYLKDLDPDPLKAQICCSLIVTEKQLPFKLCLRSGWKPGDLYMLVDLFPRHDPMNVGGVLGMVRYNSVLTHTVNSKHVTDWQNMFRVEDLSGMATSVINPNPHTVDAYYMDVSVPSFEDRKAATHAVVRVKDYNGFPMTLQREFFFVKNRFCLVRDTATFREAFLARLGPNWRTQNIGPRVGKNWANTFVSAPQAFGQVFHQPGMDLLVYHAPRPDRQLVIGDAPIPKWKVLPYTLRYVQEGLVKAGMPYAFTHLLLPSFPTPPGAGAHPADGVTVLADDAEKSVWRIRSGKDREEWVVLNASGKAVDVAGLVTDARQAYVDLTGGKPTRVLVLDGTHLTVSGENIFRQAKRGDFEK